MKNQSILVYFRLLRLCATGRD